jgi:hypothetical protein
LAKSIYGSLFLMIVERVNQAIKTRDEPASNPYQTPVKGPPRIDTSAPRAVKSFIGVSRRSLLSDQQGKTS